MQGAAVAILMMAKEFFLRFVWFVHSCDMVEKQPLGLAASAFALLDN